MQAVQAHLEQSTMLLIACMYLNNEDTSYAVLTWLEQDHDIFQWRLTGSGKSPEGSHKEKQSSLGPSL